jgi:hypothetical protein
MNEKDILISQFIDNELNIDEKIEFVKEVSLKGEYACEALELLEMERDMIQAYTVQAPAVEREKVIPIRRFSMAMGMSAAALAASVVLLVKVFMFAPQAQVQFVQGASDAQMHRFVLHMPDAENVEVAGTFSGWKGLAMKKIEGTDYWQTALPLPAGEHQYSFIVNDKMQMADPTVPIRQTDDFGGENSVIKIGDRI